MGYPSDLTDAEWALIEHYFQPRDRRGSASLHPRKRIVDAILYVVKSGCQWRMLPNDFPPLANGLRSLQPMEQTRCMGNRAGSTECTPSPKQRSLGIAELP